MMESNLQYKAGEVVTLQVVRVSDMGAFLDAGTGNTSDDILLHKLQQTTPVKTGDNSNTAVWIVLMALAGAAGMGLALYQKRKK